MKSNLKILIVGSGGREHALAWKISRSKRVGQVFITPGNGGTGTIGINLNLDSKKDILRWVKINKPDLVVVGQDKYLGEGLVDDLNKLNIKTFGPTKNASKIEWSKDYAKKFMIKNKIPTANYRTFSVSSKAIKYLETQKFPIVIKADGLAAGKGVSIVNNFQEAAKVTDSILNNKLFGTSGNKIVIEEFIKGKEVSIHAFTDGKDFKLFPISKDHKKIHEGNKGPNTGGMGTVAPITDISKKDIDEIKKKIIIPTLQGLEKNGHAFVGVLFPGIFLTENGPKVIEFNARFGDPETQSYMRLLETDLVDILFSCVDGKLKNQNIKWSKKFACCVICASKGYPGKFETHKKIFGLNNINLGEVVVFHSGTKKIKNDFLTNGGRVLGVSAVGDSLEEALQKSYQAISNIKYSGKYFRKDINK